MWTQTNVKLREKSLLAHLPTSPSQAEDWIASMDSARYSRLTHRNVFPVSAFSRVVAGKESTTEIDFVSLNVKMSWTHLWRPLYNALRRKTAVGWLHSKIISSLVDNSKHRHIWRGKQEWQLQAALSFDLLGSRSCFPRRYCSTLKSSTANNSIVGFFCLSGIFVTYIIDL